MEEIAFSSSQCKEYVKIIRDLEVSCYQQEMLLKELNYKPVEIKREITSLESKNDEIPTKPSTVGSEVVCTVLANLFLALGGAVIGAIGGFIIRTILYYSGAAPTKDNAFFVLLNGAIVGYVIALVILFFCSRNNVKKLRQEQKQYPEKLKEIENKKKYRKKEIERKKRQLGLLRNNISKCETELQQTRTLLNRYYDLGIIYPKYQGIVPICQIYEYLDSGRCFSLQGPDGAYNLYESEVRANIIISKLDDVISRLDDLSAGQQMLARVIREANTKIDSLSQSLDQIEENSALSTYYSKISAENTSYLSWLETWKRTFRK